MSQRDRRFSRPEAYEPAPRAHRPDESGTHARLEPETAMAPSPPRRRVRPGLETVLLASTAALLAAVAWPIAMSGLNGDGGSAATPVNTATAAPPAQIDPTPVVPAPAGAGTIQVALLLDTSSSMDGLIDQARGQLWRVVNAIDSVTWHGERPRLQVALYEYGNDGLSVEDGYIRQVSPFTVELDRVSEALFALHTNGGSEHAGQVIARSLDELQWADGEGTLKVIYIAGNEELAQGPVPWQTAVAAARAKGVVVNTIDCATGGFADAGWAEAAALAGGRFMQIDHNAVAEYIEAPQDAEIARLGASLNETYVGYGAEGRRGMDNQMAQDENSTLYLGSAVQRAVTKSSAHYSNPTWDLVDAMDGKVVTLAEVDQETLPEEARGLDEAALAAWIDGKRRSRTEIQAKLGKLATAREAFLAQERARRQGDGPERLDTAMTSSILEQAKAAGFTIEPSAS